MEVLRNLRPRSIQLIHESHHLGSLQLDYPPVHELAWTHLHVFFICAVEIWSLNGILEFALIILFLHEIRDEDRCSESLVGDYSLIPVFAVCQVFPGGSFGIILRVWVHVEVSRLDKFVHEEDWFWLLIAYQLTPAEVGVVSFQAAIVLVSIVLHKPDKTALLLLYDNVHGEELDHPAADPSEVAIEGRASLHSLQYDDSQVKAPSDHICLRNLSNLHDRRNKAHFLVGQRREDGEVKQKVHHQEWYPYNLTWWSFSLVRIGAPSSTRGRCESALELS